MGEIVDNCPNSRRCRWLPTQEYALRNLTQKFFFKQQEQSRWTLYQPCTYILTHKGEKHNSRKPTQINTLEKIAVFGAGGKIHRHLGTQVLPQEDEGVANHARNLKYYIVQFEKNQSLIALTIEKTCQQTIDAQSQPTHVPRCVIAKNTFSTRKARSNNKAKIGLGILCNLIQTLHRISTFAFFAHL
jgi:hypothetical protein